MIINEQTIQLLVAPGKIERPTRIMGILTYLKPTFGKYRSSNQNGTGKIKPI
jgi:hypothetical protein